MIIEKFHRAIWSVGRDAVALIGFISLDKIMRVTLADSDLHNANPSAGVLISASVPNAALVLVFELWLAWRMLGNIESNMSLKYSLFFSALVVSSAIFLSVTLQWMRPV